MREKNLQECIYSMEAAWFLTVIITTIMRNMFEGTVDVLAFMTAMCIVLTFVCWGVISNVEAVCKKRQ